MVLISSTSKKSLYSLALSAILLAGCAEEKIKPLPEAQIVPSKAPLVSGPTQSPINSPFADKTKEYGLENVKAVHLYAVDIDNDNDTDLITIEDYSGNPKFYYFDKKSAKFIAGENPFIENIRASYLNFIDFDHDDVYDVLVGNLNQKSEPGHAPIKIFKGYLENGKITYKLKTVLPNGIQPTATVVTGDFNLDGELDLFLGNWFSQDENPKPVPDVLLYGKGFNFSNVSSNLKGEYDFVKATSTYPNATPTFGASVCDVDKNGFPDILTATSNGYFNKLWINQDGENFKDYGVETGYAADNEGDMASKGGGNSFFSLCGDYNNDQIIDIVTGNLFRDSDPEYRDKSVILTGSTRSFPPKFYGTEFFEQVGKVNYTEGNRRGIWIDSNLQGQSDLLIANSGFPPDSRLMFFEQQADHSYDEKAKDYGLNILNPAGMVTIDLNGDGLMDFISGQSNVRASDIDNHLYVFINQTKRAGKGSVRFHLEGRRSNSLGISSSVALKTDKKTRLKNVEYVQGTLPSQIEEGMYFAFNFENPKEAEVRWSYGTEDKLNRVIPMVKKYNLSKFNLKGKHTELNLCDDGRVLMRSNHCY
jgi:hypothetical protein